MFQGAEGAEAAAELRGAVSRFGITLKSLKFIVKSSVLGSGGCIRLQGAIRGYKGAIRGYIKGL